MKRILAAALAALALGVAIAPAQAVQIYSAPDGLLGNQDWMGSLGLNFTVNQKVIITSLGVFDAAGDGLDSDIYVTIYERTTQVPLLTLPVMFGAGTVNASGAAYLFQSITPLLLGPGEYQLTTYGYNRNDNNYNQGFVVTSGAGGPITFDSMGGRLTADGTQYSFGTGFATIDDGGVTRYGAGSMIAAVPEPVSWALMVGGFGLMGATMRKRRTSLTFG